MKEVFMSEIFNKMADHYDTPPRIAIAEKITAAVRPQLMNAREQILIDYGGGTGLVSLPLAPLVKQLQIWDTAEGMLAIVDQKVTQQGLTNVSGSLHDLTKESIHEEADIVLLSLVMLHIPDTEHLLQQLYQLLKPGGRLFIVDFNKNQSVSHPKVHNGFEQDTLLQLAESVGFDSVSYETFFEGPQLFMGQDAALFLYSAAKPS
ncbi:class I SAM-dependent methyltransferase [Enterococcus gallinarum]|uniref:class I SAM-dependent methyltransferase n=1 Tax=Enterococcus gallinarum TaxID=1353 RepID=UPI00288E016E|nr:class I SAM-dependent methyltransferase [Enterococcus gallinarum]MDT2683954.1 class I SAM-dependent methyltransferase [Enterococcus gallinarum]